MICDYSEYEYYLVYIWNAHLFVNHWLVALFSPHNSYLLSQNPLKAKIAVDCIVFVCVWFSVVEHFCASNEMVLWLLI